MATTRPIHVIPTGKLVALVGNPNCGKTATFNALTGAHQKVANYAGVTVEKIEGVLKDSAQKIRILDLPGAYSLNPRSPDERITVDVLKGVATGEKRPDLAVCICDATNLRRSLRIVTATIRLGLPTVVVLNMMDLARKLGIQVDPEALSKELGVPVIATAITHAISHEHITELSAFSKISFGFTKRCGISGTHIITLRWHMCWNNRTINTTP